MRTYAAPEVDETAQIVVAGAEGAEFVREEEDDADESELRLDHVELVEEQVLVRRLHLLT